MMDQAVAATALHRWDDTLHEFGAELAALRADGVPERRIQALYPSRAHGDYTAKLAVLLSDSRAFSALHGRFKEAKARVPDFNASWSLWLHPEASDPMPAFKPLTLTIGTYETKELVELLHHLHPRKFARSGPAAHHFAAGLYGVPMLLKMIQRNQVAELYHTEQRHSQRAARQINLEVLQGHADFVCEIARKSRRSRCLGLPFRLS